MLYDIENERIFEWIKDIFWIIDFNRIKTLSNNVYDNCNINNSTNFLCHNCDIDIIAIDTNFMNIVESNQNEPEAQLLIIDNNKIIGMIFIEWPKDSEISTSDTGVSYIDIRITARGWFYQHINMSNVRIELIDQIQVVRQTDSKHLEARNEPRYYKKNCVHSISFIANEILIKHAMDLKQANASLGLAEGGNNQSCVTCVISKNIQNQYPTPQTRNIKIRSTARMIALAASAPRLDKKMFPRIRRRGFTAHEGMKYMAITNMHPKDYIPPTVHMKMGNAGRNFSHLKEAIVGKKIMNSNEMKKLHLLQTQLYAILAEIEQRDQFIYLSEQYSGFNQLNVNNNNLQINNENNNNLSSDNENNNNLSSDNENNNNLLSNNKVIVNYI